MSHGEFKKSDESLDMPKIPDDMLKAARETRQHLIAVMASKKGQFKCFWVLSPVLLNIGDIIGIDRVGECQTTRTTFLLKESDVGYQLYQLAIVES